MLDHEPLASLARVVAGLRTVHPRFRTLADMSCLVLVACSPAGTWLPDPTAPCQECPADSYRSGDATPENNVCKPIPAGYKLKTEGDHTEIDLCPKGQVSFYSSRNQDDGVRVPFNKEAECQACADLDAELGEENWAHTFAPRKGMTQCVPCPAGTIPNTVGAVDSPTRNTASCKACPNGTYRDAYLVSATCTDCPAGYEVGPSSKMQCNQWCVQWVCCDGFQGAACLGVCLCCMHRTAHTLAAAQAQPVTLQMPAAGV